MVSKPGPDSAWTRPPSWFAATKKRTPSVASAVASACAASATLRTPATPIVVLARYQTDPKWLARIAAREAASSRSLSSPTLNSCPIRWASVMSARVWDAHEAAVDALGVGAGVGLGKTGDGEAGEEVGASVADGPTEDGADGV